MHSVSQSDNEILLSNEDSIKLLLAIGDWQGILDLSDNCSSSYFNSCKILALLQIGKSEEAKENLRSISLTPDQIHELVKMLVSGVYNTLAKVDSCLKGSKKSHVFFNKSLEVLFESEPREAIIESRVAEQLSILNIPYMKNKKSKELFNPDVEQFVDNSVNYFVDNPIFHIIKAEISQQKKDYQSAVVNWQNACALLNELMPQTYYDRLGEAYKKMDSFPLGSEEQETLKGSVDKHDFLALLHEKIQPEFYFEIGVQTGKSLALADCEAVGIDPMPRLKFRLNDKTTVLTTSSDRFFSKDADMLINKNIGLCFIDGMHLFEYALRDFINVEKYSNSNTVVVIDDVFPGHIDQAKRERCTRAWTGDVWKIKEILCKYRKDLEILEIDAYPTGVILVSNLSSDNTILEKNYDAIVQEFYSVNVADDIVKRIGLDSYDLFLEKKSLDFFLGDLNV